MDYFIFPYSVDVRNKRSLYVTSVRFKELVCCDKAGGRRQEAEGLNLGHNA
ncbi:hypothetical protein [Calothrix rhizosoleniae]|uniref:hypothetical protein n=1 Tax=Calothrix rhizosoleniae TaxID=888997 RepID=UPI001356374B|nr:hypothetical protein [Calothrix rhizosoleniae]